MITRIRIGNKYGATVAHAYKEDGEWKFFKDSSDKSFSKQEVEYILNHCKEIDKINSSFTRRGNK